MPGNIVVLISGNGSNLQSLIEHQQAGDFRIAAVISNNPAAFGLQRAQQAGIPAQVVDHREYTDREQFDLALLQAIDVFAPDLLVLAGFMRILSPPFVRHFQGRMLNIHPSLLPAYRGTRTHQRVLDAGETQHGVSVHFVTEELDGGPVVAQVIIPVLATDDSNSLAQRLAVEEHKIYPQVVSWFCAGKLQVQAQQVWLDDKPLPIGGVRYCSEDLSAQSSDQSIKASQDEVNCPKTCS
ncbi:MAG: phosphoribosylglycinamide formyltransferase [Pseudomonadales bacterium]|nr:phosphoribosylglycinamide formyltransferase [Pseudomonadales bacterium]